MLMDASRVVQALELDEVVPCFQPLVELCTGKVAGFEVLARWNSPALGLILPQNFISLAEQNGLIGELTNQVLQKAFAAVAGLTGPPSLSVNISPIQLQHSSLPARIRRAAEEAGFPLDRLTIEITETALMGDRVHARKIADSLKAMGCRLSLDDFGTGYSSLSSLHALPFDEVKIDRSFVESMTSKRESRKIVSAIIALGHSLSLTVVAEGVETLEQTEMLQRLGCERGQGWLYGRPETAASIPAILAQPPRAICVESSKRKDGLAVSGLDALAQLQAIYDSAPVGLCFLDRDLRHVTVNRQLAELTGISVADHKGKTVKEVAPCVYSEIEPYLLRALKGETVTDVEVSRPAIIPEEGIQTSLVSYLPARDEANEVIGISVAVVDISQRKQAERALHIGNEAHRHMLELHPQPRWTMDAGGTDHGVRRPAA
jgi:PAS domain S-box-containing protein